MLCSANSSFNVLYKGEQIIKLDNESELKNIDEPFSILLIGTDVITESYNADTLLVMTVNPGFGGQTLIPECLAKIEQLVALRNEKSYTYQISVDGGINNETSKLVKAAGADVIVVGTYLTKSDITVDKIKDLEQRNFK